MFQKACVLGVGVGAEPPLSTDPCISKCVLSSKNNEYNLCNITYPTYPAAIQTQGLPKGSPCLSTTIKKNRHKIEFYSQKKCLNIDHATT